LTALTSRKLLQRFEQKLFRMKKLFLTFTLLLIGSLAFATSSNQSKLLNNVVKTVDNYSIDSKLLKDELIGTCTVTVRIYNADGELTTTKIHTFYNVASESECQTWLDAVRLSYVLQQA